MTVEPDTTLLFLGSFFGELQHAPVRDDAKLDALAMHILDEGPKTLLGLVIRARAEKWLRRHLWTLAYDGLSPFEQGVRVVVDSTMRIDCNQTPAGVRIGPQPPPKSVAILAPQRDKSQKAIRRYAARSRP